MISFEEPTIGNEEKKLLYEAIARSSVFQGPYVKKFEELFSKYCSVKYGCGCMNGTAALHLALAALDIKKGDEVIVPSFTFVATANAVSYLGAKPVFADIDKSLCIDPKEIESKITEKTKVIIPVHVFGFACDMDAINKIAKKNNVFIVEDAAEAHGAEYKGKKVGSLSDISCFSFYSNKIISTGEGGICLTQDKGLDEKMRLLRAQGKIKNEELKGDDFIEKRYLHKLMGFNYRMLDLQAAIGIAQLKKIEYKINARRKTAALYQKEFLKYNINPVEKNKNTEPVYWVYPLIFRNRNIKLKVGRELVKRNIPFLPFFWPCHRQPFYSTKDNLPVTDNMHERGISIPCNSTVTEEDALNIAKIIGSIAKNG